MIVQREAAAACSHANLQGAFAAGEVFQCDMIHASGPQRSRGRLAQRISTTWGWTSLRVRRLTLVAVCQVQMEFAECHRMHRALAGRAACPLLTLFPKVSTPFATSFQSVSISAEKDLLQKATEKDLRPVSREVPLRIHGLWGRDRKTHRIWAPLGAPRCVVRCPKTMLGTRSPRPRRRSFTPLWLRRDRSVESTGVNNVGVS